VQADTRQAGALAGSETAVRKSWNSEARRGPRMGTDRRRSAPVFEVAEEGHGLPGGHAGRVSLHEDDGR
jgi:hypothetical protein